MISHEKLEELDKYGEAFKNIEYDDAAEYHEKDTTNSKQKISAS